MPSQAEIVAGIVFVLTIIGGVGRTINERRKAGAAAENDGDTVEDREKLDNDALWTLVISLRQTNKRQEAALSKSLTLNEELRSYLDKANERGDRLESSLARLRVEVDQLKQGANA